MTTFAETTEVTTGVVPEVATGAADLLSEALVRGPTKPVPGTPLAFWYAITAAFVIEPK